MHDYQLKFTLHSDATFGRGEGIAGLIDREVEHDRYGLPYLRGRTLKGLLTEETDNILYALDLAGLSLEPWLTIRASLFGRPGSRTGDRGRLRFGPAELPAAVRDAVCKMSEAEQVANGQKSDAEQDAHRRLVLESLTAIRRQTAIEDDGVPAEGSLRAMRVILRQTPFEAILMSDKELKPDELGLLAASVLAFRRAGTGRNRGRGKLAADLTDASGSSLLETNYQHFIDTASRPKSQQEPAS